MRTINRVDTSEPSVAPPMYAISARPDRLAETPSTVWQ